MVFVKRLILRETQEVSPDAFNEMVSWVRAARFSGALKVSKNREGFSPAKMGRRPKESIQAKIPLELQEH